MYFVDNKFENNVRKNQLSVEFMLKDAEKATWLTKDNMIVVSAFQQTKARSENNTARCKCLYY